MFDVSGRTLNGITPAAVQPNETRQVVALPQLLNQRWSDKLAFEVALMLEGSGEPIQTILKAHAIDPNEMIAIGDDPVFQKRVDAYRTDIRENGLTFKLKAKAQAEILLETSYELIHSPDVPATVKADLIKSTVKWAGYEPKNQEVQANNSEKVSITINMGDNKPPMKVIDHE